MKIDSLIAGFDKALRTLFVASPTVREVPGTGFESAQLATEDRSRAAALMRVNHVGEVCAQALYQAQAWVCRDPEIKKMLARAADEEVEHLAWTERRIAELGGRKSALNPLWYSGAFAIGVCAGALGDRWSLGFLAETERQVESHLDHHLSLLPPLDVKSRAIVNQMKIDEAAHAETAVCLGAHELPYSVTVGMRLCAKVMTGTSYSI